MNINNEMNFIFVEKDVLTPEPLILLSHNIKNLRYYILGLKEYHFCHKRYHFLQMACHNALLYFIHM